jgi:hypothetical protein
MCWVELADATAAASITPILSACSRMSKSLFHPPGPRNRTSVGVEFAVGHKAHAQRRAKGHGALPAAGWSGNRKPSVIQVAPTDGALLSVMGLFRIWPPAAVLPCGISRFSAWTGVGAAAEEPGRALSPNVVGRQVSRTIVSHQPSAVGRRQRRQVKRPAEN